MIGHTIRRIVQTAVIVAGIILGYVWYLSSRDYSDEFATRKGALSRVDVTPSGGDSLREKSWITLHGSTGLKVECGLLAPVKAGRVPVIVVLGGKATGKYAVDYALDINDAIVVAVDYPYEPRKTYTITSFVADVPAMRRALLDMVPSVMLLTDYLSRRDDVDTTRIVLMGYSFGAQLVPAIAAHDKRTAAAVMVYGGGDLYGLIRHNVRRYESAITSECVAAAGAVLLQPLEPMRYARDISPRPLLMVNGVMDEQIPRAFAERFYKLAGEPKKIVWIESAHVNPRNMELTRRIVELLRRELRSLGVVLE